MNKSANFINFLKFRNFYFGLSLGIILLSVYFLAAYGLNPAVDFTGGTLLEISVPSELELNERLIEDLVEDSVSVSSVQPTSNQTYIIRTSALNRDQSLDLQVKIASLSASIIDAELLSTASATVSSSPVTEVQSTTVGPTLGRELIQKTVYSIAIAITFILLYIAYRFKNIKFGLAAIIAMLHDSLILLGSFALLGRLEGVQVDTLFVTALLTTLSFSLHDTIVVFDRIRESKLLYPSLPIGTLVNKSLTETITRSINNSLTIIFMLFSLWLLGGDTTRWFVFALLIGTIAGTYSSTFLAAPLLFILHRAKAVRNS